MKISLFVGRLTTLLILLACLDLPLSAQPFHLASVLNPTPDAPAGGGGDSLAPVISPDGRYVLFASSANNLVLNTNNSPIPALSLPKMNVFLRDRTNGTTTLISVNLDGTGGGNGDSFPADISTNGQYVLFESSATNLVAGDANNVSDIFVRDLVHNTTLLVSVATNSTSANGVSGSSVLTPDAHYVAFTSAASNLVSGDINGISDVFVRDLQSGTTTLASPGAMGPAAALSESPDITPDGHYVAFYSTAANLVPGVTTIGEIYIRDLMAGTTSLASGYAHTVAPSVYGTTNTISVNHVISDDGQFVAYEASSSNNPGTSGIILRYSQATGLTDIVNTNATGILLGSELNRRCLDLTPDGRFIAFVGRTNGTASAIFVWDAASNTTTLASGILADNSVPANSICDWPLIDPTGRFVAFLSSATGLTTNTVAGDFHLYLRDLQSATTQLVDVDTNGVGSTSALLSFPRMSTNGLLVAFEAPDGSLVPGDNNAAYDVFLRNIGNQTTELVSAHHPDLPSLTPNAVSTLSISSVSTNARYIAFSSAANNLVANDTNKFADVFVRDLWNGTNILVSVDTNGVLPGSGLSTDSAISGDGRYVAFTSWSSNLVAGDNNNLRDVFVRDLQLGTTALVSVNTSGTGPGTTDSYSPLISANGRYVLFRSTAQNLAAGIPGSNLENLYWRDLQAGITRVFTTNTVTGGITGGIIGAAMTPDGRFVAVAVGSSVLYVWDTTLNTRVYTNITTSASTVGISPDGTRIGFQVAGTSGHVYAANRVAKTSVTLGTFASTLHAGLRFSADNRYMAYVAADVNKTNQVYLYDFQTATSLLVSQATVGAVPGNGHSDSPDISSDGHFIVYRSIASNLGPGASNGVPNLYLYDRLAGTTLLLGGDSPGNGRSLNPVFSGDGQTLVFESWATGLAAQDFNQWGDIFTLGLSSTNVQPPFSAAFIPAGPIGQPPVITWTTTPGKTYQVQFKNQLSDPVWQVLNGPTTITGSQETMSDPSPAVAQRFYRVVSF